MIAIETKDWLTVAALIIGPTAAVIITLWHQSRAQRRGAKERLFLTLMAHRRSNPPTADWASSLNLIDVVFADNAEVVRKWHALYAVLNQKPWNNEAYTHSYLELLSEMASVLGYKNLQQTDIDRFYLPAAHGTQAALTGEVQAEFLRVLKATKNLDAVTKKK